ATNAFAGFNIFKRLKKDAEVTPSGFTISVSKDTFDNPLLGNKKVQSKMREIYKNRRNKDKEDSNSMEL
ncbi:hypothetical protein C0989_011983, partial [Termitomyces sp. Mn162]